MTMTGPRVAASTRETVTATNGRPPTGARSLFAHPKRRDRPAASTNVVNSRVEVGVAVDAP